MPSTKTIYDLKSAILGYMNRQESTFIVQGANNVMRAINNAKDYLQRAIDFEYAKTSVLVPNVPLLRGGSLNNAILFEEVFGGEIPGPDPYATGIIGSPQTPDPWGIKEPCPSPRSPGPTFPCRNYPPTVPPQYWGGPYGPRYMVGKTMCNGDGMITNKYPQTFSPFGNGISENRVEGGWQTPGTSWSMGGEVGRSFTRVDIKKVLRGYLPFIDNTGVAPIMIMSKQEWAARRERLSREFTSLRISEAKALLAATGFAIVLDGKQFFVDPQSPQVFGWQAAFNVYFDVIRFMEDFNDVQDFQSGQFLLDYCFDVLLLRAIVELNYFLKEDERVAISTKVMADAWNNIVQWNATIVGNTVDVSLD